MSNQRGLVPTAIVASTIVLVLCAVCWGALGVATLDNSMPFAVQRYLCILLGTVTVCSVVVNGYGRLVRLIRSPDAYTVGYTDGLDARPDAPAVTRLVRTPR
jgi:hypothetical protein